MKSIFNHKNQHSDLNAKLVLALERISHVFRLLLWEQTKKYNLSPIQTQILIYTYYQPVADRNITTLSHRLNVTKATTSDAVKSLEKKKLIVKEIDEEDNRYFFLSLSVKGKGLVKKIEGWTEKFKIKFELLQQNDKVNLYETLLKLLVSFEEDGILSKGRICLTCKHFNAQKKQGSSLYFCQLLNQPLKIDALRLDCLEYQN